MATANCSALQLGSPAWMASSQPAAEKDTGGEVPLSGMAMVSSWVPATFGEQ